MTLTLVKGAKDAPRAQRSKMETLLVSLTELERWQVPPFQRPLTENAKVRALAERLKTEDGGVVPGVVTLGRLPGDQTLWVVDGQHRIHAGKISGLEEVIVDVRIVEFENEDDMAKTFVELQSSLVRMRPDDMLRGLEGRSVALQRIRKHCPFVGYDQIRRQNTGPILSMSLVLRSWIGSVTEVPKAGTVSAVEMASMLDPEDTKRLIVFLERALASWGRDPEYYRFWSALNLTLCMWTWRRMVLQVGLTGNKRWTTLTAEQFAKCMTALTADKDYHGWLAKRPLVDLHRSPCYRHIRRIFAGAMADQAGEKVKFPQPPWMAS